MFSKIHTLVIDKLNMRSVVIVVATENVVLGLRKFSSKLNECIPNCRIPVCFGGGGGGGMKF